MARFALLHSPFVGPASWGAVAAGLQARGHDARAYAWPRLDSIEAGYYPAMAAAMAANLAGEPPAVLVAHNGAGALMPALIAALGAPPAGVILVDAILPHPGRSWLSTAPPDLAAQLRAGEHVGLLPSWDQWWPPGALERLVPDAAARTALVAECEQLPIDFLEEPAPEAALGAPTAFLQLSGAYDDEGQYAVRQGWPVVRLPLHHLAMLTHAEAVAGAIAGLAERLGRG